MNSHISINLAREFSRRLRAELSPTTLEEVIRRNLSNPPGVCASHDFCDPNETMDAAAAVLGVDPMTDEGSVAWTRAWNIAKATNFQL